MIIMIGTVQSVRQYIVINQKKVMTTRHETKIASDEPRKTNKDFCSPPSLPSIILRPQSLVSLLVWIIQRNDNRACKISCLCRSNML
jgi:hypothetical protein